MKAHYVL